MRLRPARNTHRPALPIELLTVVAAAALATQVKTWAEGVMQPLAERAIPPSATDRARLGADPEDHPENMPPDQLVDKAADAAGRELSGDTHGAVSEALHWATGIGAGTTYGLLAHRLPAVRWGGGALFGAVLLAATHGSLLPALGVQDSPAKLPGSWWVWEPGSHLVYGMAVDAALRLGDALTRD